MNLNLFYKTEIRSKLFDEFHYANVHQIPKLQKIVISSNIGLQGQNQKQLEKAIQELRTISGQHPIVTKAKKSIANFKIREDMIIGLKVTLRREKMYNFFEKLTKLVLPRIRDFQGLNPLSFDKFFNYHIGIKEQFIFPEIEYENIDQVRGFNISIINTAETYKEAHFLLKELGLPLNLK